MHDGKRRISLFAVFVMSRCGVLLVVCVQGIVSLEDQSAAETSAIIGHILEVVRESQRASYLSKKERPHLTLSFAQSLDGKLSPLVPQQESDGEVEMMGTSNFALSGPESLLMTHAIRSIHDGILIGGRTLSIDNPRLSNRLWRNESGELLQQQPRPIVLDPMLRHIHLISNRLRAKRLIVFCSELASLESINMPNHHHCDIVSCRSLQSGNLDLHEVLRILKNRYNIRSIMVEGGASVLTSFIEEKLCDFICITIAPQFIGPGVCISTKLPIHLGSVTPAFRQLGEDCVMFVETNFEK